MTDLAGWSFEESVLARSLRGEIMPNPSLDLGSFCDLNCPYCFTELQLGIRRSRRRDELDRKQVFAVLEDFAGAGARTVNIVGAGEPMLNALLVPVIEYLHVRGIVTVVFTHGLRIARDSRLLRFFSDHKVTIVIKVNSFRANLQDALVGRKGYSVARNKALRALFRTGMNKSSPTRLGVDTLAFMGNYRELPRIHRWCRRNNIYPMTADYIPAGRTRYGTVGEPSSAQDSILFRTARAALIPLSDQQRRELSESLANIDAGFGIQRAREFAYYGGGTCTQLLGVYVDVEGKIWPCVAKMQLGLGDTPLGSVHDGDLPSQIWRSSECLRSIRDSYTGGCPYKESLVQIGSGLVSSEGKVPENGERVR